VKDDVTEDEVIEVVDRRSSDLDVLFRSRVVDDIEEQFAGEAARLGISLSALMNRATKELVDRGQ
jgi:hypothetical protein